MPQQKQKKTPARSNGKHPGGRPTDYRPEYCDQIIALGKRGMSKAQMAREFNVTRDTLDNWAKAHPEFLASFTHARDLSLAQWEDRGETGLGLAGFNGNLYAKIMAARFPGDYSDHKKVEVTGKDGAPLQAPTIIIVADDEAE